jgi:hydroxymethylbilane synthase
MLDHEKTRIETGIERIVVADIEGGCTAPVGSFTEFVNDEELHVLAEVLSLDGTMQVRIDEIIPLENYEEHARRLAREMVAMGGKELVQRAVCQLSNKML